MSSNFSSFLMATNKTNVSSEISSLNEVDIHDDNVRRCQTTLPPILDIEAHQISVVKLALHQYYSSLLEQERLTKTQSNVSTSNEESSAEKNLAIESTIEKQCKASTSTENILFLNGNKFCNIDPQTVEFSEEELKPQPMKKRSRKKTVPDNLKTERYWSRRLKNNRAAKESRVNRRIKENKIIIRTQYLEQQNLALKSENEKLKQEQAILINQLQYYYRKQKLNI